MNSRQRETVIYEEIKRRKQKDGQRVRERQTKGWPERQREGLKKAERDGEMEKAAGDYSWGREFKHTHGFRKRPRTEEKPKQHKRQGRGKAGRDRAGRGGPGRRSPWAPQPPSRRRSSHPAPGRAAGSAQCPFPAVPLGRRLTTPSRHLSDTASIAPSSPQGPGPGSALPLAGALLEPSTPLRSGGAA